MANILDDTGVNGKRGDFEAAVAYLLPKDPVIKCKQQEGKHASGEISGATGEAKAEVSDFGAKPGIGKTGVHLRYHDKPSYNLLTKPQQDELREWRKTQPPYDKDKKKGGRDPTKCLKSDKAMAAAVEKAVAKKMAERDNLAAKEEEANTYLTQMIDQAVAAWKNPSAAAGSAQAAAPLTQTILTSILKRAKAQK